MSLKDLVRIIIWVLAVAVYQNTIYSVQVWVDTVHTWCGDVSLQISPVIHWIGETFAWVKDLLEAVGLLDNTYTLIKWLLTAIKILVNVIRYLKKSSLVDFPLYGLIENTWVLIGKAGLCNYSRREPSNCPEV